jgi:ABC-type multidrug transport system fused ATPase/permease subunit
VDEATDTLMQETIARSFEHATVLVIAHRVSTLRMCQRIVHIEDGRVARIEC